MDLDDDEDDRPRRRRPPADPDPYPVVFPLAPPLVFRVGWLVALALGGMAVLVGFSRDSNAFWAPAFVAAGCFLGITARVLQAEEARALAEEREAWRARRATPPREPAGPDRS